MVCISSKSFEKHLLVIWSLLLILKHEVGCVLPVCSLLLFSQHDGKQITGQEKVARSVQGAAKSEKESAGTLFYYFCLFVCVLVIF